MSQSHDVVIVGGGLVGSSLALALDRAGIDVALVEATAGDGMPAVFDQRNLSFAEATVHALTALGVMQALRLPAAPIARIHVSRRGDFGRVLLQASAHGRAAFGQVVVASDLGQALAARLAVARNVTRYRAMRHVGSSLSAGGATRVVQLEGSDGPRTLDARLLVGADGAASAVRDSLGIGARHHDYGQTLFVARVRARRLPDGTAYERFGDDGPTALLPRGDGCYGAIMGVARDDAAAVAAMDDGAFLARLQAAFGWRVGAMLGCGERSAYPVASHVADALVAPRAVLVGNAAQSVHPIGAQGFNLGLRDALTLAEVIAGGSGTADRVADPDARPDPGSATLLHAYAARRTPDRDATLAFCDALARVTATPGSLLRPARSIGLLASSGAPWLQARLVGGAMGYRGDVPGLCRGVAA